jgi:hypothetical protein
MLSSAEWLLATAKENPAMAAASAAPFLRLCGNALGGYYLIRSATLAQQDIDASAGDSDFLHGKIISARFYAAHVLPTCAALAVTIRHGASPTLDMLLAQS